MVNLSEPPQEGRGNMRALGKRPRFKLSMALTTVTLRPTAPDLSFLICKTRALDQICPVQRGSH